MTTATSSRRRAPVARPLDLIEAKVSLPALRPGIVPREALVERLLGSAGLPVVSVVAPAGYGKTTLLAQWSARDPRPFAWVQLDERDNDPVVLLAYAVAAFEQVEPVPRPLARSLSAPVASIWLTVMPRVGAMLATRKKPFVLVLDDVHELTSRDSLDAVAALLRQLPAGSQLALVGRSQPLPEAARLRACGRLLELGADDLSLTADEAAALLTEAGASLPRAQAAELHERTEGWAAGLYLAALALRDESPAGVGAAAEVGGSDRFITDYLRSEHLSGLARRRLEFITRTSVLDRMSGPLCDAVLERKDSARMLETIESSNLFLIPLDHRREWYRYHHLFREALQAELERRDPGVSAALCTRAAAWCEENGLIESAIEYALAAGDMQRVARLLATMESSLYAGGRRATVGRWLDRFDDEGLLERYPTIALLGAYLHAVHGRAEDAERWLQAAQRSTYEGPMPDGSPSLRPWVALTRALFCRDGVEHMRIDAETAVAELAPGSNWRPNAFYVLGVARLLAGDVEHADAAFSDCVAAAATFGPTYTGLVALAQRALLALERDDQAAADKLLLEARGLIEEEDLGDYPGTILLLAARARSAIRRGDVAVAKTDLAKAQRLRPQLNHAIPSRAVLVRIHLARAQLALADAGGARTLLAEADEILRRTPDLGVLGGQVDELRRRIAAVPNPVAGWASTLTAAELRLLPLLATHLTFSQIGERLFVSRNTVKTQAISAYRKLGASSRNEAIARAAELGLLELHV